MLAPRLPGESPTKYLRRTVPGWEEYAILRRARSSRKRRWVQSALKNDPSLDDDDITAIRSEAGEAWDADHPERAKRLSHLSSVIYDVAVPDAES